MLHLHIEVEGGLGGVLIHRHEAESAEHEHYLDSWDMVTFGPGEALE